MQHKTLIRLYTSLAFSMALVNYAEAAGWQDLLNAVRNSGRSHVSNSGTAVQQGQQAISTAQPVPADSLAELLMQRTGVTGAQAQGGAGALFQIAKNKMQADSFAQLEQSVPGIPGMLGAVPALPQQGGLMGGLSSIAGTSGGAAGDLLAVASAFQQQGMSPAMVQQFIPVVIDYVKAHGSDALVNSLSAALTGR